MAARTIAVTGNEDMSGIASTAAGADPGTDTVSIVFDDADDKTTRAAALRRAVEKLVEEGHA